MTTTHGFIALAKRQYDKAISIVAVVLLLLAIMTLVMSRGRNVGAEQTYEQRLDALEPSHPTLEAVSLNLYSNALGYLARPFRINTESFRNAGFFVPESRVWCVNPSCRALIPRDSTNCPVCNTPQPVEPADRPDYDGDGGGIPDWWEIKYGLNPRDPKDDRIDSDGDGFDNLAEFLAGTDPLDPKSHPDLIGLMRVANISATRLPIKFMAATQLPNGKVRCQINLWEGDGRQATSYFAVEGEMIGKTDFKLLRYVETVEERFDPMMNKMRKFTDKKIEIGRGEKVRTLGLDENAIEADYLIKFVQTLDGSSFEVAGDGQFRVGQKKYRVISVDNQAMTVVLRSDADGVDVTIPRL